MADTLHPYTVAAVVDTRTGDLVGTPIIRSGHENYTRFDTVQPLAADEQFRWVHVWAPDRQTAAATGELTADLQPDTGDTPPSARALTGTPGLKPFTVASTVDARTGRPIGTPIAARGHHALPETFTGSAGSQMRIWNVWARNRTDAIAQISGAAVSLDRPTARPAARRGLLDPEQIRKAGAALAWREWNRRAGLPDVTRVALVADAVWRHRYQADYSAVYAAVAGRIAAAATEAAARNPHAWLTLHHLATAADQAAGRLKQAQPVAPQVDRPTMAAAAIAATRPTPEPPWRHVARVVTAGGRTAASLAGTLTATTDALVGWRARFGHAMAEDITVDGRQAQAWVGELLATLNQDTANHITTDTPSPPRTPAQLAHEDQAPSASPGRHSAANGRSRAAGSTTQAHTSTHRGR